MKITIVFNRNYANKDMISEKIKQKEKQLISGDEPTQREKV
jgi:hypothetical protein